MKHVKHIKDMVVSVRPASKTRRLYSTFLILLLPFLYTQIGHAHGGRTASDGCHNDNKNGGRHCHGGSGGGGGSSASARACPKPDSSPRPSSQNDYDRQEWNYRGYSFTNTIGFYSGLSCSAGVDTDHVVSLKDAHDSGGLVWNSARKSTFANDIQNLVPSCSEINRSKGASLPLRFITLAGDGSGVDFDFTNDNICKYLTKYRGVKVKYQLAFDANDSSVFNVCNLSI